MEALEDFRDQPLIGEVAYRIEEATVRPLLFHDFANTAYYLTVDALRNFEHADAVGSGPFVVPAITFWFMAVESYVSTIYKTCAAIDESLTAAAWGSPAGHELCRTGKVVEKMTAVKTWIAGACPPSPPHNRLREFATFRNALLHDLTTHSPRTAYAHTRFAPRAEKCNQADLIEAVNVALETFTYFRFVFNGTDLMPSVSVETAVEKLDVLADEVLYPVFADILAAKEIRSVIGRTRRESCPAQLRAHMQLMICVEGPTAPRIHRPQGDHRLIADEYQDRAIESRPVDDAKFQVPDYTR